MTSTRADLESLVQKLRAAGYDVTFREPGGEGFYQLYEDNIELLQVLLTAAGCIKFLRERFDWHK